MRLNFLVIFFTVLSFGAATISVAANEATLIVPTAQVAPAEISSNATASVSKKTLPTQTKALTTKININTANLAELLTVKGMNREKAKALLAYRQKNGEFKSLASLAEVKGFKRLQKEVKESFKTQLII